MIIRSNQSIRLLAWLMLILTVCLFPGCNASAEGPQLSPPAIEAARLLKIQPQLEKLIALKGTGWSQAPSDEELSLQLLLARKILGGSLEVRKVTDTIDQELASEYTAQGEMIASRDRGIELNNIVNFSQNGVAGLVSGGMTFSGINNAGNDLDIVSGGTTLLLASAALLQTRGGRRKLECGPNMLGQVLNLDPPSDQRFSPLLWTYLNSVPLDSKDGMTRREQLIARWKKARVLTINLNEPKNLEKVAVCGPGHKRSSETIKLIQNRIVMLHDVHTVVESLDSELVDLLRAVD